MTFGGGLPMLSIPSRGRVIAAIVCGASIQVLAAGAAGYLHPPTGRTLAGVSQTQMNGGGRDSAPWTSSELFCKNRDMRSASSGGRYAAPELTTMTELRSAVLMSG